MILVYSLSCANSDRCLVAEHFHCSQKTSDPLAVIPSSPSIQLLETTHLHSLSMDLPFLNISYKRNHAICNFLCLASLTLVHVVFSRFIPGVACISISLLSIGD